MLLPDKKEWGIYQHDCEYSNCVGCKNNGFNEAIDLCQLEVDKAMGELANADKIFNEVINIPNIDTGLLHNTKLMIHIALSLAEYNRKVMKE